jgi:hypothetical protein
MFILLLFSYWLQLSASKVHHQTNIYKKKPRKIAGTYTYSTSGSGSSVGIATDYGFDGPQIEFRWERDFPHLSRPALWSTQTPLQWVPGLPRG